MPRPLSLLRASFPFVALIGCFILLGKKLVISDFAALPQGLQNMPISAFGLCVAFTAVSLWAVGRYDVVAHRHMNTRQPSGDARHAGTIAIALSQTVGFGLFTGALARWRMLPDLAPLESLRLSSFVSLTFMVGLGLITAVSMVVFPAPTYGFWPAVITLACLPIVLVALYLRPALRIRSHHIKLPSLLAVAAILFWTLIDTAAAGMALYVLLPGQGIDFNVFFPVFLLALGAGLITGTPGGIGPFELIMLTLLPHVPSAPLLAALVGYRVIYYACPAILAMCAMVRPCRSCKPRAETNTRRWPHAPRAEVGIIRQNGGQILPHADGHSAVWPGAQSLTALFDPINGSPETLLAALADAARDRNLVPCLYKSNARTACIARKGGWHVIHIADEAVLLPQSYDTAVPQRRNLRRKLRAAEKMGVTISMPHILPWSAMAAVDAEWQNAHGTARGGTMGRFCPDYMRDQKVFLACQNGKLIAYISFHLSSREWCLDLMRHTTHVPDGTMHALINQALIVARQANILRLSLAAIPACPNPQSATMRWFSGQLVRRTGGPGLRQFKSAFAPKWQPLYAASPTKFGLMLALADITRAVLNPTSLTSASQSRPHEEDEYYEVASSKAA